MKERLEETDMLPRLELAYYLTGTGASRFMKLPEDERRILRVRLRLTLLHVLQEIPNETRVNDMCRVMPDWLAGNIPFRVVDSSRSISIQARDHWLDILEEFRDSNPQVAAFAQFAATYVMIPASEAPVERLFSDMSSILTPERTNLDSKLVEAILRLKFWIKKRAFLFPDEYG